MANDNPAGDVRETWSDVASEIRGKIDALSSQLEAAAGSSKSAQQMASTAKDLAESASLLVATTEQPGDHRDVWDWFFGTPAVVLLYVIAAAVLFIGTAIADVRPLLVMLVIFFSWDLLWACKGSQARTAQETLNSSTRARTYMSYFLTAYGAGIAFFLFRFSQDQQDVFFELVERAGLWAWLLIVPFGLFGIALLFIPIKLGEGSGDLENLEPSSASRWVLGFTAFVQKIGTYIFLYSIIAILLQTGGLAARVTDMEREGSEASISIIEDDDPRPEEQAPDEGAVD